jgi:hypothetical protein
MKPSGSNPNSLSGRLQRWWWKGTPPVTELDGNMAAHVDALLAQAAAIQRTAELEAHRVRSAAVDCATRMLARVEAVEDELQAALETVADGKKELLEGIAEERARMDGAAPVARLQRVS